LQLATENFGGVFEHDVAVILMFSKDPGEIVDHGFVSRLAGSRGIRGG
jgi:hypothetical protein